jgi:hypothetical protein
MANRDRATPGEPSYGRTPQPRLALSRRDAAAALGMSLRHFQRHVQPHLRCIYAGQLRLYPVAELERWIREQVWRDGTAA